MITEPLGVDMALAAWRTKKFRHWADYDGGGAVRLDEDDFRAGYSAGLSEAQEQTEKAERTAKQMDTERSHWQRWCLDAEAQLADLRRRISHLAYPLETRCFCPMHEQARKPPLGDATEVR